MKVNVDQLVKDAESEVIGENFAEKKEQLKTVLREIQEAKEITRRLEAKKERLIEDLKA